MAEKAVSNPKEQWQVEEEQIRNWLDLPSDVTANILNRIGVDDILENAQKVCTTWRKICKDPAMWRVIHMSNIPGSAARLRGMCKHAVDLSQGQLIDISIMVFANDELLQYVADRSSELRRLEIVCGYQSSLSWLEALNKFSLLEELNLYKQKFPKEAIVIAGLCCPMLRTLRLNQETYKFWPWDTVDKSLTIRNETAIAIGENLPELRHLQLIENNMSNTGLQVILDGCCHLESLDLRQCWYIDLKGDIGKKLSEKIKCLKLPNDSLEGCLYFHKSFSLSSDSDDDYNNYGGLSDSDYDEDYYAYYSP